MRLSTALPLVLLPALTLAHHDPLRPAHHRRQLARHGHVAYGKRVPAIDDILGGGSTSSSDAATSTASADGKSTSGAAAATSAVASTSEAATTTNRAEASTSTADTSSAAPGTSQAATSTVNSSSAGKSSAASSAAGSSSASASASASASDSSSASGAGSIPASGLSASSSQSASPSPSEVTETASGSSSPTTPAAQSVQYTTDSSGQTQMITVVLTQSADDDDPSTANAAATASSANTAATNEDDGSLSTGAIIGICVGVGVAVLALIGLALCRMRKRSSDEDEAIRWPELNRHGDSDVHHALPARETGQHGFETSGMSRPLSSGSSIHYADYPAEYGSAGGDYLGTPMPHTSVPMALGGSNFGASSTLEDEYDEKYSPAHLDHSATHLAGGPPSPNPNSLDEHDNYSSLPPPVQPTPVGLGMGGMMYGQGHPSPNPSEHAMLDNEDVYGGMGAQSVQMTQMGARGGVTYPQVALTSPVPEYGMEYPDYPRGGY
ncbi:hypothetical protein L198_07537 [Cryptococcus wingfieldii CBS 7118]|uniref:Mid2 domain-containing protein n=1 Tax=Cryptococcus wingfieldii CBS 7118 TaxID=1295528 RepID=A0A1E3IC09_9TREE|nr:hypothetical protein L198_07537 [Cryptococcus wingfieldii CBS 7118]ODN85456.1 hypothetical protein L198_07537 [Cryptococcus wingfieldii CBS 7118]